MKEQSIIYNNTIIYYHISEKNHLFIKDGNDFVEINKFIEHKKYKMANQLLIKYLKLMFHEYINNDDDDDNRVKNPFYIWDFYRGCLILKHESHFCENCQNLYLNSNFDLTEFESIFDLKKFPKNEKILINPYGNITFFKKSHIEYMIYAISLRSDLKFIIFVSPFCDANILKRLRHLKNLNIIIDIKDNFQPLNLKSIIPYCNGLYSSIKLEQIIYELDMSKNIHCLFFKKTDFIKDIKKMFKCCKFETIFKYCYLFEY